ncbi:hypothetical protein FDUTEX481_02552 [Tolypothrix sp. PCC 7601]|nr:hypothetical protein FDUTEX481_02552 [Tolypothrix sp. PCC 7601]
MCYKSGELTQIELHNKSCDRWVDILSNFSDVLVVSVRCYG